MSLTKKRGEKGEPAKYQVDTCDLKVTKTGAVAINRFVGLGAAGSISLDAKCVGVTSYAALEANVEGIIQVSGVASIELGEEITVLGAELTSDGTGKAISSTIDSKLNGYALEVGASGAIIQILLR